MNKKLIVINGTMGVGKSTISTALKDELENSIMLDGDWCWMMNPWNITEENIKMVEQNIIFLLNSFLNNSSFRYVIFTWVLHNEMILDNLLEGIDDDNFELHFYSLVCNKNELIERMENDSRTEINIKNASERIPLYLAQRSKKIDTTGKDIMTVVKEIKEEVLV